jgi:hypothetical protein
VRIIIAKSKRKGEYNTSKINLKLEWNFGIAQYTTLRQQTVRANSSVISKTNVVHYVLLQYSSSKEGERGENKELHGTMGRDLEVGSHRPPVGGGTHTLTSIQRNVRASTCPGVCGARPAALLPCRPRPARTYVRARATTSACRRVPPCSQILLRTVLHCIM